MAGKLETATLNQISNLEKSTGKSFDQWLAIARKHGGKHSEIVRFLKEKYGLGHGNANLIAIKAREADAGPATSTADPADAWFQGDKASLRPLYNRLMRTIQKFGNDVELSPKKTYMSLRRNRQFAALVPSTAQRLDVGLNLKDVAPSGRLEAGRSWNSMFSHRVRITNAKEIDKQLIGWLRKAYDQS
jgi:hypothetical protein